MGERESSIGSLWKLRNSKKLTSYYYESLTDVDCFEELRLRLSAKKSGGNYFETGMGNLERLFGPRDI